MSEIIVTALFGLIGAVFGTIVTLYLTRRQQNIEKPKIKAEITEVEADAAGTIGTAALALLQPYKDEVDRLRTEVRELREEVKSLINELHMTKTERDIVLSGAHQLYHQVQSLGGNPVYRPPSRRSDCGPDEPDAEGKK